MFPFASSGAGSGSCELQSGAVADPNEGVRGMPLSQSAAVEGCPLSWNPNRTYVAGSVVSGAPPKRPTGNIAGPVTCVTSDVTYACPTVRLSNVAVTKETHVPSAPSFEVK